MKNIGIPFFLTFCLFLGFLPNSGFSQLLQQNPTPPIGNMIIKGDKAGVFHENGGEQIGIIGFSNLVHIPLNMGTGMMTGKRTSSPIVIVKEWGESTPQLYQALANNENLDIRIEFFSSRNITGINTTYQIIHLTNARLVQISSMGGAYSADKSVLQGKVKEELSIIYDKITIESPNGKTAASDNWSTSH